MVLITFVKSGFKAAGVLPHPEGDIKVVLEKKPNQHYVAEITSPGKLAGNFSWKGKQQKLHSGYQKIEW